jgi:hypothetical protein
MDWVGCPGELLADLGSLRDAEPGVDGKCLPPLVAGFAGVAGCVIGTGEAVVRAGLLVPVAYLAGQAECCSPMASSRLPRPLRAWASPARSPISRCTSSACW